MVRMRCRSSFVPVPVLRVFLVILFRLFPLDQPPVLAQARVLLAATVRGHRDLH